MAYIERRQLEQRDKSGRTKSVVRYKIRYRDAAGKPHSETKRRLVDAERRKAEIELEVGDGLWRDPVVVRSGLRSGPPIGSRPGMTSG
jgi:hypothetical protein